MGHHHSAGHFRRNIPPVHGKQRMTLFLLLLSGDIALNPGPRPADIFPCGYCALPCNWSEQAIMCDACEVWFHKSCHSMSDSVYHGLSSEDSWQCYRCHSTLWDTFHSWELSEPDHIHRSASSDDSRQRISSSTSAPSHSSFRPGTPSILQSDHPSVVPTACSSLSEHLRSHSRIHSTTGSTVSDSPLLPDKKNWCTLVLNANSVVSETKRAEFANLVDYVKPDAIIVTETKLSPDMCSSEFMPSGYGRTIRKDKKKGECGVLIAVKECYTLTEVDLPSNKADIVWGEVCLKNGRKLYIGSFYRTPSGNTTDQMNDLETSLKDLHDVTRNRRDAITILGGDFNLGDIRWENESVLPGASESSGCQKLIDILHTFGLSQLQRENTSGDRLLDLYATNRPALVKSVNTVPSISDHDGAIVVDSNILAVLNKKTPRKLFIFSKAQWNFMKTDVMNFSTSLLESYKTRSINLEWYKVLLRVNYECKYPY